MAPPAIRRPAIHATNRPTVSRATSPARVGRRRPASRATPRGACRRRCLPADPPAGRGDLGRVIAGRGRAAGHSPPVGDDDAAAGATDFDVRIDSHQRADLDDEAGLLQRLARRCLGRALAVLDVAGRQAPAPGVRARSAAESGRGRRPTRPGRPPPAAGSGRRRSRRRGRPAAAGRRDRALRAARRSAGRRSRLAAGVSAGAGAGLTLNGSRASTPSAARKSANSPRRRSICVSVSGAAGARTRRATRAASAPVAPCDGSSTACRHRGLASGSTSALFSCRRCAAKSMPQAKWPSSLSSKVRKPATSRASHPVR